MNTDLPVSIYCVIDPENQVEAHVFEGGAHGYAVRVLDSDAGEWVPGARLFASYVDAESYADLCVRWESAYERVKPAPLHFDPLTRSYTR